MKKIVCLVLVLGIVLSATACHSSPTMSVDSKQTAELTEEEKAQRVSVPDVSNKTLPLATEELENWGLTNISSNANDPGWDQERWIVVSQSIPAGELVLPSTEIVLTCAKLCQLYIDVKSESNLMLNKYDIELYIEGEEIGTVANGGQFTKLLTLKEGSYKFIAYKTGDHSVSTHKTISISGDMTFQCLIKHDKNNMEFRNLNTIDSVEGSSLVMEDTVGMVLSDAMAKLSEIGFSNVREEPYGSIWDKDNWIVIKQNIETGTSIDKTTFIQLDCIKLDEYFNDTYTGKNATEILSLATESGFAVRFVDSSGTNQTDRIVNAEKQEQADWIAIKASQYAFDRIAQVTVSYQGKSAEATNQSNTSGPSPTKDPNSVPYSTNSKDTVRNGNSGVYAYANGPANGGSGTYNVYWIIDFDEGYVYSFSDGVNEICDKVKIESGDLNSVLIITYHDGDDVWSYGLCFHWKNQPDTLIVQLEPGMEIEYRTTNLEKALAIRDSKKILDYSKDVGDTVESTPSPTATATSTPTPKKYTDSEVKKRINEALSQTFMSSSEYKVEIKESVLNIMFYPEGLAATVFRALVLEDKSANKDWNSLVNSAKVWSKDLSKEVNVTMGRDDLMVALYYCDDTKNNGGDVFLIIVNGVVYYDGVNDVDLMGLAG